MTVLILASILSLTNRFGSVAVDTHGARVVSYVPAGGSEVLEMLPSGCGGVPLCWPWFQFNGPRGKDSPKHGLARYRDFTLAGRTDGETVGRLTLRLESDEGTRREFPHDFRLTVEIRLLSAGLSLTMTGENTGREPFAVTEAFHPYIRRTLAHRIPRDGSGSFRTWDPGPDAHLRTQGLAPEDWRRFVCVENGVFALDRAYVLRPGESHALVRTLRVEDGCAGARDVYLLIGQSNMAGRGVLCASNRVDSTRVVKFDADGKWVAAEEPIHFDRSTAGAGLAASFARVLADSFSDREIGLVPCAVGGTSIARWQPGTDLYENAVDRCRRALESGGELKAILWHQGESDAKKPESVAAYADRLVRMVQSLRKDLNAGNVPFLVGELAGPKAGRRAGYDWDGISAATHAAVARLPESAVVSSEGLTLRSDGLHFDTASLRALGERYAKKSIEMDGEKGL